MSNTSTDNSLAKTVIERFRTSRDGKNSAYTRRGNIASYIKKNIPLLNIKDQREDNANTYINLLMVVIENLSSLLSDNPIMIQFIAAKPFRELDAMLYEMVTKWVLTTNNEEEMREKIQKNMFLVGTGIIKIVGDPDKEKITLEMPNPCDIYVDPLARTTEDINYITEVVKYSKQKLKKKYPNFNPSVDQGNDVSVTQNEIEDYNSAEKGNKEQITVYEHWVWDDDVEKYPQGRYIVCTETQILEDRPNEYACGFPYVFFPGTTLSDRIYGLCLFDALQPASDEMNRLLKRIHRIVAKVANPIKVVSTKAGIELDDITNEDGKVIPVNSNMDVRAAMAWEPQPVIHPMLMELLKLFEYFVQTLGGVQDITMGRAVINSSVPPNVSLETLREQSQTRLRQVMRNIKRGYKQLGVKLKHLIPQIYSTEKIVKITGADAEKVIEVLTRTRLDAVEKMKEAGLVTPEEYEVGQQIYDAEMGAGIDRVTKEGAYMRFTGSKLGDPEDVDVSVEAGTDLPKSKIDVVAEARNLKASGEISLGTFLDITEFPKKEKILEESPIWQEFLQFKQMQAQQQEQAQKAQQQLMDQAQKQAMSQGVPA